MKNKKTLLAVPAIALVLAMMIIGCGGGGSSPTDLTSAIFTANDGAYSYEMVITKKASGRAAYEPKKGDSYVMIINPGNIVSSGTVKSYSANDGTFTLASGNDDEKTFTVTFYENTITNIYGDIPRDDGEKFESPVKKSVTITGITDWINTNSGDGKFTWERGGVFLFTDIDKMVNGMPINTAIQYGYIENGSLSSLPLVIPFDNTWNGGMPWAGKGEFYVLLVPVYGQTFYAEDGKIYTNSGSNLVKVSFNDALTTLDFSKFKDVGDSF